MPPRAPHIVLMGLRASGKSTLALLLAERANLPCTDLDHETLKLLNQPSTSRAWTTLGQIAFREAEFTALNNTLSLPTRVIALGGGTPTAPGAEKLLRNARAQQHVLLVYLRYPADTLRARLAAHPAQLADRPAIQGASPLDEIPVLLAQRDPLYSDLADLILESPADAQQATRTILDRHRAMKP